MERLSCYYSYKAMVLRKTLINYSLHTLILTPCWIVCKMLPSENMNTQLFCLNENKKKRKQTKLVNVTDHERTVQSVHISSLCIDAGDLAGAVVHNTLESPSMRCVIKMHFLCLALDIKSCRFTHTHTCMHSQWVVKSNSNEILILGKFDLDYIFITRNAGKSCLKGGYSIGITDVWREAVTVLHQMACACVCCIANILWRRI